MNFYAPDTTGHNKKKKIECKPELVIASLQRFYATHPEIHKVIDYLIGDAPLSLRIIDWFVTKYSRKNFVRYHLNGQEFLVYLSYKGQLKAYSKQYFDPNCRRERIMFTIPGYDQFMTTIGKLNFFRWALETKIIDYIEENEEDIRTGYNSYLKETTQIQKRLKNETMSSTDTNITVTSNLTTDTFTSMNTFSTQSNSMRTTRRRRTKQTPSSLNKLQVYTTPIQLDFS
jgi:hypothetical protein